MAKYPRNKYVDGFVRLGFGSWSGLNIRVKYRQQNGWIQSPVTSDPLPYYTVIGAVPVPALGVVMADQISIIPYTEPGGRFYDTPATMSASKAYSKFVHRANGAARAKQDEQNSGGSTANLALTLIDWRKSAEMIEKRGLQLLRAVRALKKFDIPRMARELGVRVKPGTVGRKINGRYYTRRGPRKGGKVLGKTQADLWLEYSFGWSPLFADIYDATQVLGNTIPSDRIRARGQSFFTASNTYVDDRRRSQSYEIVCQTQYVATVKVSNPNLLLLNQLGLVNPAYVLWDAVPFSFVVDWFLPVGRYLKGFSDFVGMELINPVTTTRWIGIEQGHDFVNSEYSCIGGMRRMRRELTAPALKFPSGITLKPDLWKAVTSSALILQKVSSSMSRIK